MLVERDPLTALIENSVLLILAIAGCFHRYVPAGKRFYTASGMISVVVLWMVFRYFVPASWSVVRPGTTWRSITTQPGMRIADHQLLWVFEADCEQCQTVTDILEPVSSKCTDLKLFGITSATQGRIDEFIYDFEPGFPIFKVSSDEIKRMGVPSGSLIEIIDGRVIDIIRIEKIPSFVKALIVQNST